MECLDCSASKPVSRPVLRARVVGFSGWRSGNPLNREGIKEMMKRKNAVVVAAIDHLLSEGWLHQVTVPSKERQHPLRSSYFISLTAEEREEVSRGGGPPAIKIVIPASWSKTGQPHIPDSLGTDDLVEDVNR
jgi:hypothetical protein